MVYVCGMIKRTSRNLCSQVPLFAGVSESFKWRLCSRLAPRRYGPGEDIVSEGQPATHVWFLLEGAGARLASVCW